MTLVAIHEATHLPPLVYVYIIQLYTSLQLCKQRNRL